MIVGIMELVLDVHEAFSLKDKRRIVKSLIERIRRRFNVSMAETDHLDVWNRAGLGVALVSNNQRFVNDTLQKLEDFIDKEVSVEIIARHKEIL